MKDSPQVAETPDKAPVNAALGREPEVSACNGASAEHWITAGHEIPLDQQGPVDVPFEPFNPDLLERPLIERFNSIVARFPDKIAVDDGAIRLSYHQLQRACLHLAQRIGMVVPPGRPVAVLLSHDALFPLAALACFAAGRPYVAIDRTYPAARNAIVMREAAVSAAIIAHADDVPELDGIPYLDITSSLDAQGASKEALSPSDGPALILFTSGSTGRPKGICNDQRAILQRVAQATNSCHLHAEDRIILLSSACTIAGVRETFCALLNGATLYVADPLRLGISGILQVMRDARITAGYIVPALLRTLMSFPDATEAFAHMRILRVGGDIPLESDLTLIRGVAPQARLLIAFSSTEMPTIFQWFVPADWKPDALRLPIGYAQPGFSFMMMDERGAPVPRDEVGELVVKSRYLALGYWQEGRLIPGPFVQDLDDPSIRILKTGDLVQLRADALADMVGRRDFQIKIRGLRVNLGDPEAVLRGSPGVVDAAVIARHRGEDVSHLVAFVVPRRVPGDTALMAELKTAFATRLPQHMRPTRIHFISSIPKLPGFKTDVHKLEELDQESLADGLEAKAPDDTNATVGGGVGDLVERAWTTVLGRQSFHANLPWDAAGGDSLSALRLRFIIEEALRQPLSADTFLPDATPSALVQAIESRLIRGGNNAGMGERRAVRSVDAEPLTFAQTLHYLAADLRVYHHRFDVSTLSIVLTIPGFQALVVHRLSHWLSRLTRRKSWLVFPIVALDLLMRRLTEVITNIYIAPEARIGPGLFLPHFGGIVIGSGAVIGAHCEIFHNVTLGRATPGDIDVPHLGDRVYLGPGAILLGGIEVGDDAYVSANSVLSRSVPARACVVGNPSRIVSHNGSFELVNYPGMEIDEGRRRSLALRGTQQLFASKPKPE
jgi:non-ribosomal peptide synthetase component F/serine acetyltransferase